jgi:adenylate cyclase
VLEGSVRKAGQRVRISARLIEAASGAHLWADRFDGSLDDVFELQDRVLGQCRRLTRCRSGHRDRFEEDAADCCVKILPSADFPYILLTYPLHIRYISLKFP